MKKELIKKLKEYKEYKQERYILINQNNGEVIAWFNTREQAIEYLENDFIELNNINENIIFYIDFELVIKDLLLDTYSIIDLQE